MRFIELLAVVKDERTIESYETTLFLTVEASIAVSAGQLAIALREEIVKALLNAGLTQSDIHEGGSESTQRAWSTRREVTHRIVVRHAKMDVLVRAMNAVERVFAAQPRPWFSSVKPSFTFDQPKPVYAEQVSAGDLTRKALSASREMAETLASEAGASLGPVLFIAECSSAETSAYSQHDGGLYYHQIGGNTDFTLSEPGPDESPNYTTLPEATGRFARLFRVRYALLPNNSPGSAATDAK